MLYDYALPNQCIAFVAISGLKIWMEFIRCLILVVLCFMKMLVALRSCLSSFDQKSKLKQSDVITDWTYWRNPLYWKEKNIYLIFREKARLSFWCICLVTKLNSPFEHHLFYYSLAAILNVSCGCLSCLFELFLAKRWLKSCIYYVCGITYDGNESFVLQG